MSSLQRTLLAATAVTILSLAVGCSQAERATSTSAAPRSVADSMTLAIPPMDSTGSNGNFRSLTSRAKTDALPSQLMVYKVKRVNVKREGFERRARALGLTGSAQDLGDTFAIANNSAELTVDKATGSFDYTTRELEKQTRALTRQLSDDEYRVRAEDFLSKAGLLPEAAEFRDVNRGNVIGTYENGHWVEKPYMIEVRFSHRPLGGVAFDQGVGPKVVVQFGEDGKILGALSVWREVEPHRVYALKSGAEAVTATKEGRAQVFDAGDDETGTVDAVGLSFMNEPLGYDQQYVLPAYVLRGTTAKGNRFTVITSAIPEDHLRVDTTLVHPVTAPQSSGKK